jgi:predicted DsbA family dithiol-disulfide isomerase
MIVGVLAATAMLSAAPAGASSKDDDPVLVEVNGVKLTLSDLEPKSSTALFQARTTYYETERKVIEDAVDQYLLDQQARKEGVTVPQLYEKHVNTTIAPDPSEEALQVYFEGLDTTEPYVAVRGKIVDALRQRRIAKAKLAYLKSLRNQGPIVILLEPPRAPISMKDVPVRGEPGARVSVVEFADYECPYCQQIQPVLASIETEFKGKITLAYKDFPLPMHPSAPKAAEAAHCAGAQGKYWEYHDTLYAKKQLDVASLKTYAGDLKLDTAAFATCLDKGQMAGQVSEQASEAQSLALQGTPTFLVNGRMVNGALSYEKLRAVILEELSASGGSQATARSNAAALNQAAVGSQHP